jgi:hypothetical protein
MSAFYQKVKDPELQCQRCTGSGMINETKKTNSFGASSTVTGPCEDCNGTGRNPATKTESVELTQRQIEYLVRALGEVKDSLGGKPVDDANREVFEGLYQKFSGLLRG